MIKKNIEFWVFRILCIARGLQQILEPQNLKIATQSTKSGCNRKSGFKRLREYCKILRDKILGISQFFNSGLKWCMKYLAYTMAPLLQQQQQPALAWPKKAPSATASYLLCSLFQLLLTNSCNSKEKAGYFMTCERLLERPLQGQKCLVAGVIVHGHLASYGSGNLGGRVCVLEGWEGPAGRRSWVGTQ